MCGFLPWFGSVLSFRVLDDAICVVGECEFLQCTVLGKHGAVSDDVTLRGAGRHLFLKPSPDPLTLSLRSWHALTGRE